MRAQREKQSGGLFRHPRACRRRRSAVTGDSRPGHHQQSAQKSRLLLVELEDLNPYLSILEVDPQTRDRFMQDFVQALEQAM